MQNNNSTHLKIPPRWLHCPRKGLLMADKFLVFKTPLDSKYESQIPDECRFDLNMLFSSVKYSKIKLGLVIDLTNTTNFYDKELLQKNHNCRHCKLSCKGHGETPTVEQTNTFINVCDRFINTNPLDVIGVHCTHGFNRSGFLVIAFLVTKFDYSLEAALLAFASCRPPGIYKSDYIEELYQRFGTDMDNRIDAPRIPDWCLESDDTDRDDDGNSLKLNENRRQKKEINKMDAIFMDGEVPGVETVTNQTEISHVQETVQQMCDWKKSGFPGSQPISMDLQNLKFLIEKPYKVSWKADGTRYMMLIEDIGKIYMLDRDNACYKVTNMTFPRRKEPNKHIFNTLLDGEMILDKVNDKIVPRYLIYDVIVFENQEVGKLDFNRRLLCIEKEIIFSRNESIIAGKLNKTIESFSVRAKPFWDISYTNRILDGKFSKEVTHEVDGLIFQPVAVPYKTSRCSEMLKWKPPELNTIDFRLVLQKENKEGRLPETACYLFVGGADNYFGKLQKKSLKNYKNYNNKILECKYDAKTCEWIFLRERTDKSFPNGYETAKAVAQTIINPVTKEILYKVIYKKDSTNHKTKLSSENSLSKETIQPNQDQQLMPPPQKIACLNSNSLISKN